jgi:hypothetical protein
MGMHERSHTLKNIFYLFTYFYFIYYLTRFPGPELLMTIKRDGDTSRTVPVNLFMLSDGKHESGDVASMFCERRIAIRSIVVQQRTSIDISSVNNRFDAETPRPDVVPAQRLLPISDHQTAEIEGLLQELQLFSLHNVTPMTPRGEPVSEELPEVDMNTMLIHL